ncbi:flagellar hook-basal body protein FliE [Burkholderia diffusa]|uniref:Flagellar hook-basal body complex protein FliE n=2 Tax=Burkholderia diffusa TaxID=488732 RepID=A0AAW3P8Q0_9BURK|nr:flagellar hook-basal body protein FliE [Burkholderia diffusa]KVN03057.1 flagellar hook-basal body protein FliE [Burkholderia diffusa]KWF41461.1 flagellar hook-basal body protein FliE [Burkholderia diffusa]KWF44284.1 flagellar hook-basal body protein FliE [Burkholderia diffusa]KWF45194.1 flagellar hook-basal body protein FliE [Burkholderia diffusa]
MESIQQVSAQLRSEAASLKREAADIAASIDGNARGDVNFASVLGGALNDVDNRQLDAAEKMSAVDSGRSDDLIGAMLASQEASLSFSMLTQVRNKLTTAMDDLLKMQI